MLNALLWFVVAWTALGAVFYAFFMPKTRWGIGTLTDPRFKQPHETTAQWKLTCVAWVLRLLVCIIWPIVLFAETRAS